MKRILRNAPHEASPVDEVVVNDVTMHLEQMSDEAYWIGVSRPGTEDSLDIDLVVENGKLVVTVREEAWTWERDESHESPLQHPAKPTFNWTEFQTSVEVERANRLFLKNYLHWKERGNIGPPPEQHWCQFCAGYFGVPHGPYAHPKGGCSFLGRAIRGDRQCACIECVVAERMVKGDAP